MSTWAPIARNLFSISGKAGAYLSSTDTQVRVIEQPFFIKASDRLDLKKIEEELSEWLITDEPAELIFDDEPDRVYYAVVDGSLEMEEVNDFGRGVITFICPDPYKYGQELEVTFANSAMFYTEGSVETYPIVEVEVKENTTFLSISDGENINLVGNPATVDQAPFERKTKIFESLADNLTGWSISGNVEGGAVAGTMSTDGYFFYSADYGNGAGWHGPSLKRSLSATIQDFELEVYLQQYAYALNQVGKAEVAVLDANDNVVAKVTMQKVQQGVEINLGVVRAGSIINGHNLINTSGSYSWTWNKFDGILRISRIGNSWEAYIAKVDKTTYKHDSALYRTWTDTNNIVTAPIAQVQVYLAKNANIPVTTQKIDNIRVYRINNPNANQIPYVASAGDIITFDHVNDIILKNGEDITKEKAFIADYFPLKIGRNTMVVEPANAVKSAKVRWRDKWR